MSKPVLVIMAAGMGSRYGGLKQIDPIDDAGHIIMDFSLYDARKAGFEEAIFIIKKENEAAFREAIGDRVSQYMNVSYAFQDIAVLPEGYSAPEDRVKPWGTAHAILCAMDQISGPFAVINADDYYGREAFSLIYDFLSAAHDDDKYRFAMVGYLLKNTVTDNGYVARGVCVTDGDDFLKSVVERTRIEKRDGGIAFSEDGGETWEQLPSDSIVSMNLWGFSNSMLQEIKAGFPVFLDKAFESNPLKGEYFLPSVVSELIEGNKATVKVLTTPDKWFGVTYKEDKPVVIAAMKKMKENGVYPENLWGGQ